MVDDREAFTAWAAEQRQLALLRTAVLLTGDPQRAEDLVQEALTKVALRWRRLRDGHPDAYARRILVRDNISWWRKHRAELVVDVDDPRRTPSGGPRDRRLMLKDALGRLTPKQRAVVVLRFLDDLSERDTAEAARRQRRDRQEPDQPGAPPPP